MSGTSCCWAGTPGPSSWPADSCLSCPSFALSHSSSCQTSMILRRWEILFYRKNIFHNKFSWSLKTSLWKSSIRYVSNMTSQRGGGWGIIIFKRYTVHQEPPSSSNCQCRWNRDIYCFTASTPICQSKVNVSCPINHAKFARLTSKVNFHQIFNLKSC